MHAHPHANWQSELGSWWRSFDPKTLNVAGPRLSKDPIIASWVIIVLNFILTFADL
jgi:hypothetical protein